jgi:hypothetical protein
MLAEKHHIIKGQETHRKFEDKPFMIYILLLLFANRKGQLSVNYLYVPQSTSPYQVDKQIYLQSKKIEIDFQSNFVDSDTIYRQDN